MRLGGGGMSSVSFERRTRAPDFAGSRAMAKEIALLR
jgi:hypothetical protein